MIAIDFFCGAGGLTRGLLNAGITVKLGIDVDPAYESTYLRNNEPVEFLCADMRSLSIADIHLRIGHVVCQDLLFVGCAPCQPFTKQLKNGGSKNGGNLITYFGKFIKEFLPGQVFVENVPGIRKVRGFSAYRRFVKLLDKCGYSIDEATVDAKDYGVPQTRRRFILIAMREAKATIPPETNGPSLQPYVTVGDTIRKYPRIKAGQCHPSVPNHVAAALSEQNMERMKHTPQNGGNRLDWPDHLRLDCHRKDHSGHTDVYGRMWWKQPAPALTTRCNSLSNGRYGHPSQRRAISLREAAALQSFSDNYVFHGSNLNIALQIGNAVPVKLAEAVGLHILKLRKNTSKASMKSCASSLLATT